MIVLGPIVATPEGAPMRKTHLLVRFANEDLALVLKRFAFPITRPRDRLPTFQSVFTVAPMKYFSIAFGSIKAAQTCFLDAETVVDTSAVYSLMGASLIVHGGMCVPVTRALPCANTNRRRNPDNSWRSHQASGRHERSCALTLRAPQGFGGLSVSLLVA